MDSHREELLHAPTVEENSSESQEEDEEDEGVASSENQMPACVTIQSFGRTDEEEDEEYEDEDDEDEIAMIEQMVGCQIHCTK